MMQDVKTKMWKQIFDKVNYAQMNENKDFLERWSRKTSWQNWVVCYRIIEWFGWKGTLMI